MRGEWRITSTCIMDDTNMRRNSDSLCPFRHLHRLHAGIQQCLITFAIDNIKANGKKNETEEWVCCSSPLKVGPFRVRDRWKDVDKGDRASLRFNYIWSHFIEFIEQTLVIPARPFIKYDLGHRQMTMTLGQQLGKLIKLIKLYSVCRWKCKYRVNIRTLKALRVVICACRHWKAPLNFARWIIECDSSEKRSPFS